MAFTKKKIFWVWLTLFFNAVTFASADSFFSLSEERIKRIPVDDPKRTEKFWNSQHREGFLWYTDLIEKEEKKEEKTPSIAETAEKMLREQVDSKTYTELWNAHPEELRQLQEVSTKLAIQAPTQKNIYRHLFLQDLVKNKATAFAYAVTAYGVQNDAFDTGATYPIVGPGQSSLVNMRQEEISITIQRVQQDFGLILITQSGCRFCDDQKNILRFFQNKYPYILIKEIDLKTPLAMKLGVTKTPSIVTVSKKTEKSMPVASGVVAVNELEHNLFRAIRLLDGNISPEQYGSYDFNIRAGEDPHGNKRRFQDQPIENFLK
ncbi:MAG: conjugal transfer protein TraF [Desulforegulaceae bacterium]|nr:conjugal transfer protein TraF [Desulforegulaceae bacterium]